MHACFSVHPTSSVVYIYYSSLPWKYSQLSYSCPYRTGRQFSFVSSWDGLTAVVHVLIGQGWQLSSRCPDKTSGDKTSGDKTSVDKTSVGTERPWGQNVRSDKTSVGQNVRGDKRSVGQKVRRTKRPWGQNVRGDKTSVDKTSVWVIFTTSGSYLPGPC
jgi:hypothetical protein